MGEPVNEGLGKSAPGSSWLEPDRGGKERAGGGELPYEVEVHGGSQWQRLSKGTAGSK